MGFQSVSRKVQHRSERDAARAKEIQQLRQENNRLTKQVARLRKLLAKQVDKDEALPENEPEGVGADRFQGLPTPVPTPGCQACGSSNLGSFTTPGGRTITSCKDCKARQ